MILGSRTLSNLPKNCRRTPFIRRKRSVSMVTTKGHMCGFKNIANCLLGLFLSLCSLWLVWDLCLKFFSGSTTIVREQQHHDYLPLPQILLCLKERYKSDELSALGLPKNFFDNGGSLNQTEAFPDLNATWQSATWPSHELEADWSRYEGENIWNTRSMIYKQQLISNTL